MKKRPIRRRDSIAGPQRAFTLSEMMVTIIIVGILAAIAIPIYTKLIEQSKASEAKAMIAAIVSAEKAYAQKNGSFINISRSSGSCGDFCTKLKVDILEAAFFDFEVTEATDRSRFVVTATVNETGKENGLPEGGSITYTYDINQTPRGQWGGSLE